MMNATSGNGMLSPSTSATGNNNSQSPGLKTSFKTPEGKYKLQFDKTHPSGLLLPAHGKTVTKVTLAYLKDRPTQISSQPLLNTGVTGSMKSVASRFLGGGNGSRSLSFVGGNGGTKLVNGSNGKVGTLGASTSNSLVSTLNFEGKGTYLIFNVGDTIFVSDLNSKEKDPVKSIQFSNSHPVCHAFDPDSKDGHDLLIGLTSGDVYSVSLRQQLQDVGKKLVGAQHYNKDGSVNSSRCTSITWVPRGEGTFVAAHSDGNMYVYEKNKDGSGDPSFPLIKDQTQFSVVHARNSKNPIARWHICQGPINNITFSTDGAYIATVGRDGYLRVFDYKNEQLVCGGKSYYGSLLCCAWSMDGKYILTGGEDDLVQVWSMDDRRVVAWGEGHNSWVSEVAFDSHWLAPNSDGTRENVVYRFGSVGQDAQLLLWDLEMDEIVVPMRRPPGGSPTFSNGSHSSHWDSACPVGVLQPAPSMKDVPKLSPFVAHRVHTEPLSGLICTQDSVVTVCRDGHIKIWMRPDSSSDTSQPINSDL